MKNNILYLIILCLVCTNCDIPLDYQYRVDNRLEGKDELTLTHSNPATGLAYTEAELAALNYDPTLEDFFIDNVDLTLTIQAQPLTVEVINTSTSNVIATLDVTENNGSYIANFSSTVAEMGVGIGDNVKIAFKVTYDNKGEEGFDYNAVLSYDFIIRDKSPNLALNKPATASAEAWGTVAASAVDGVQNGGYPNIIHTNEADGEDSWFEVDLGAVVNVRQVNIWNRADCCADRLTNYHIFISETPFTASTVQGIQAQAGVTDVHEEGTAGFPSKHEGINVNGRYVRLQLDSTSGSRSINMAEFEVY
ncbi:discoidin domain-containing protein [Flavivirga spongiicola]|uniref:Discoidin domain-containing protein n=1 Tax=Flavivirga spongiicola TaxID=421621 RepID=A0ABU7XXW8_9FLAO|nr:discoidin domain-containing protein [Flavivirga sp. MEBiC05379]MDO5979786.1 discoidin domain-containing protein [Flavivirga sp. MEBiC05379]